MQLFHVVKPLFGIAPGRVERFAGHKSGAFLADGSIEPYDEKRHGDLPGAPPYEQRKQLERDATEQKQVTAPPAHKQVQAPIRAK